MAKSLLFQVTDHIVALILTPPANKYEILLDMIPKLVFELSEDGIIRYVNNCILHYGYTKEDLIGKNILDFVHPGDMEQADRQKSKDISPEDYNKRGIKKGCSINTRRTALSRITRGLELRFLTKEGEYKKFNKTQKIESDFDKMVKGLGGE